MFGSICFLLVPMFVEFYIFAKGEDLNCRCYLNVTSLDIAELGKWATPTTVTCQTKMAVLTLYNEELKQRRHCSCV